MCIGFAGSMGVAAMQYRKMRRSLTAAMAALMVWLSVWTPSCLAMGVALGTGAVVTSCDCPFAGQPGGMAAGCAQADHLGTYLSDSATPKDGHLFHALPVAPLELPAPASHPIKAAPLADASPPTRSRRLHLQYCVFLN